MKQLKLVPIFLCATTLLVIQVLTWRTFGDPDGWYHLGMAQLYRAGWQSTSFAWLPHTILQHNFFDQQYAYHWLLALSPSPEWAKILTILLSLALFLALAALLKNLSVRGAHWWALGPFLLSSGFLARVSLVKGGLVGPILYLLTAVCLIKNKRWPLALIGFAWVLTHGSFILLLPLIVSYGLVHGAKPWSVIKSVGAASAGLVLGYLFHPGHEAAVQFFSVQLAVPLNGRILAAVGAEWYPYGLREFWSNTWPLLVAWAYAVCHLLKSGTLIKKRRLTVFGWLALQSFAWFLLTASSKRFIEYWAPLALLPVAIAAQQLAHIDWRTAQVLLRSAWQARAGLMACVAAAITIPLLQVNQAREALATEPGADQYKAVSVWLAEHSRPGDIVLNTRWDSFPQLFYWNKTNYYAAGLDQLFLYAHNKELYTEYHKITNEDRTQWGGRNITDILRKKFKARYVLINNTYNPRLLDYLKNNESVSGEVKIAYRQNNFYVLELR